MKLFPYGEFRKGVATANSRHQCRPLFGCETVHLESGLFQEGGNGPLQGRCNPHQILQSDVALAAFDRADISAMKATSEPEFFLRDVHFLADMSNHSAELGPRTLLVHRSRRVDGLNPISQQTIGSTFMVPRPVLSFRAALPGISPPQLGPTRPTRRPPFAQDRGKV